MKSILHKDDACNLLNRDIFELFKAKIADRRNKKNDSNVHFASGLKTINQSSYKDEIPIEKKHKYEELIQKARENLERKIRER
jgi:hypothetical protein